MIVFDEPADLKDFENKLLNSMSRRGGINTKVLNVFEKEYEGQFYFALLPEHMLDIAHGLVKDLAEYENTLGFEDKFTLNASAYRSIYHNKTNYFHLVSKSKNEKGDWEWSGVLLGNTYISSFTGNTNFYLEEFYVKPNFRNEGLARQLIGCMFYILDVFYGYKPNLKCKCLSNNPALKAYRAFGFSIDPYQNNFNKSEEIWKRIMLNLDQEQELSWINLHLSHDRWEEIFNNTMDNKSMISRE